MKIVYFDCFSGISGDMVLGALVVFGAVEHPSLAVQIILFVAVVFGTLNVIGGFIVVAIVVLSSLYGVSVMFPRLFE